MSSRSSPLHDFGERIDPEGLIGLILVGRGAIMAQEDPQTTWWPPSKKSFEFQHALD